MLRRVLRAPMYFFETTPTGRMINRFSKDQSSIDVQMPTLVQSVLNQAMTLVGVIAIISIEVPYFLALIPALGLAFTHVQYSFRCAARELKRLDSITRSPLYSNFDETLHGISSIAAFGRSAQWVARNDDRADRNYVTRYCTMAMMRWMGLRLELIGSAVVFSTAVWVARFHEDLGAGGAGLVLLYSTQVTIALMWLVRSTGEIEVGLNAVERVREYGNELPLEEGARDDGLTAKPAPKGAAVLALGDTAKHAWPLKGALEFVGVYVRYRSGLPCVLNGISLRVEGGSKVGFVGRTGSGKSTLAMAALFRTVGLEAGSILIDGVDTKTIGLRTLRRALASVPQDPVLFQGSLRQNLDPFDEHGDEDLVDALRAVQLRLSTPLSVAALNNYVSQSGENWSLGERQLICMARAMLRSARILVMDEAPVIARAALLAEP